MSRSFIELPLRVRGAQMHVFAPERYGEFRRPAAVSAVKKEKEMKEEASPKSTDKVVYYINSDPDAFSNKTLNQIFVQYPDIKFIDARSIKSPPRLIANPCILFQGHPYSIGEEVLTLYGMFESRVTVTLELNTERFLWALRPSGNSAAFVMNKSGDIDFKTDVNAWNANWLRTIITGPARKWDSARIPFVSIIPDGFTTAAFLRNLELALDDTIRFDNLSASVLVENKPIVAVVGLITNNTPLSGLNEQQRELIDKAQKVKKQIFIGLDFSEKPQNITGVGIPIYHFLADVNTKQLLNNEHNKKEVAELLATLNP